VFFGIVFIVIVPAVYFAPNNHPAASIVRNLNAANENQFKQQAESLVTAICGIRGESSVN
jgi:hypothetical protein